LECGEASPLSYFSSEDRPEKRAAASAQDKNTKAAIPRRAPKWVQKKEGPEVTGTGDLQTQKKAASLSILAFLSRILYFRPVGPLDGDGCDQLPEYEPHHPVGL
jgi:hypothetical protein